MELMTQDTTAQYRTDYSSFLCWKLRTENELSWEGLESVQRWAA